MRRGLMGWDQAELPKGTLGERLARLQGAMARDGFDALLIYTNIVRPSAVSWLTAFTPYWIESLLLVRRNGVPILATALSKRVADWIRATSWLEEIINTPKPGAAIGQRLAADGCKRVGVLELDALPAGLYDDVTAAASGVDLVDAGATFASCRRAIDATERRLIGRADALAVAALGQVDPSAAKDAGVLAGLIEKHARLAAAEEVYIAVAADLDADRRPVPAADAVTLGRRFAVRASVAYKGNWVRRTRSFARDEAGARAMARGDAWLAGFVSSIAANKPLAGQLEASLNNLPGAELRSFMAESVIGTYPLEVVASSRTTGNGALPGRSFAVLSVELAIDGVPWLGAAPAFVGG
jgi:Xaa-Pro aminopeptidase